MFNHVHQICEILEQSYAALNLSPGASIRFQIVKPRIELRAAIFADRYSGHILFDKDIHV